MNVVNINKRIYLNPEGPMRNKLLRNAAGVAVGLFFAFSAYTLERAMGMYYLLFIVPGAFATLVFAFRFFLVILDTITYNHMILERNLIAVWKITPAMWQESRKFLYIQDKKGRIAVFCIMSSIFAAIGFTSLFSEYLQGKIIGVSVSLVLILVFWVMMFTHKRYHLYNSEVIISRYGVVIDDKVCDWLDAHIIDYSIKKISGEMDYIEIKYSKHSGNKTISENIIIPIPPDEKDNADNIVEKLLVCIKESSRNL
jgi:hypothetical protein